MESILESILDNVHDAISSTFLAEEIERIQQYADSYFDSLTDGIDSMLDIDFNGIFDNVMDHIHNFYEEHIGADMNDVMNSSPDDFSLETPQHNGSVISFTGDCWNECKAAGNISKLRVTVFYSN